MSKVAAVAEEGGTDDEEDSEYEEESEGEEECLVLEMHSVETTASEPRGRSALNHAALTGPAGEISWDAIFAAVQKKQTKSDPAAQLNCFF